MGQPRQIKQPGPALPERIVAVEGRGRPITVTLEAGRLLVETLAEVFLAQGFAGGTVDMAGVVLAPFVPLGLPILASGLAIFVGLRPSGTTATAEATK